jgi:hypothetical protein
MPSNSNNTVRGGRRGRGRGDFSFVNYTPSPLSGNMQQQLSVTPQTNHSPSPRLTLP